MNDSNIFSDCVWHNKINDGLINQQLYFRTHNKMKQENNKSITKSSPKSQSRLKFTKLSDNQTMARENSQLIKEVDVLKRTNDTLKLILKEQQSANAELKETVSQLQVQLCIKAENHFKLKQEMADFLETNHEVITANKLQQLTSFKDLLNLFINFIREGPLPTQQSAQLVAQTAKVTTQFITHIQSAAFTDKIQSLRMLHKSHKNEIIAQLKKDCEQHIRKNNDQDKSMLHKERQMIADFPQQLKILKEASRNREEVYRKHLYLLERQIKENCLTYQTKEKKYQEEIEKLKQNYSTLLAIHKKEVEIPIANIKKNVDSQIEHIKVKFEQSNRSKNIQDVTDQLISAINRYLNYQDQSAEQYAKNKKIITMEQLKGIGEWWEKTLKLIDQTLRRKNQKVEEVQQFIEDRMREQQQRSKEQKKQYNVREMQTKINCQREYIIMLEKYQNKLQSCIKRISTDIALQNDFKQEKLEYDQQRKKFEQNCITVKESNQKVVTYLIDLKKIQMTNRNEITELKQLFRQCLAEQQKMNVFKQQLTKFMEHDHQSKKYIYEQTNRFSQIFMEHYAKLASIREELPVLQSLPAVETKTEEKQYKVCEEHRDSCIYLMKEHEELAKCKKVIEARLTKAINDILSGQQEYLKVARCRQTSITLNIQDKLLNSMSNKIYMKLEETFRWMRSIKEELGKIECQSKHGFECAMAEMKKLMSYLRGNKFQQKLNQLCSIVEAEHRYLVTLQEMVAQNREKQSQS